MLVLFAVISGFDNEDMATNSGTQTTDTATSPVRGNSDHSSVFYVDHREGLEYPTRRPKKLKSVSMEKRGRIFHVFLPAGKIWRVA